MKPEAPSLPRRVRSSGSAVGPGQDYSLIGTDIGGTWRDSCLVLLCLVRRRVVDHEGARNAAQYGFVGKIAVMPFDILCLQVSCNDGPPSGKVIHMRRTL